VRHSVKHGGGVTIRVAHLAHERRALADVRERLRADQRAQVIRQLAEKSGLPFDLAITNIERWSETEQDHEPHINFVLPYELQPVAMVTTCYVRAIQYLAERRWEGE
jgi:hypothetical protein